MRNILITTVQMLLHHILVWIVKLERLLRRQKIRILNPAAMNKVKSIHNPIIFAPTHCGKYDIQVMTEVLWQFRWSLLSGDPYDLPGTIEGWWLKLNGVVYVDRDNKEYRRRAKREMVELLRKGLNLMLYPEGTWNFSPNQPVLPLFRGVSDIACETNATIVPFGLEVDDKTNTYYVIIGEPIGSIVESLELLEKLRDQMATLKWKLFEYLPDSRMKYDSISLTAAWNQYIQKRLSECHYMNFELIWKYARKESWQLEREQITSDIERIKGRVLCQ